VTAAIALAVVLVIVVAGASMAMENQRSATTPSSRPPSQPRPSQARTRPAKGGPRGRKPAPAEEAAPPPAEPEVKPTEILPSFAHARARVLSVVDERTIGPVTRSRLSVRVEPEGAEPFEATVRVAFQTPQSRAAVKVGGTLDVRFDPDDHSRVVVELPPA
jgi:hypothetical protein